jgi:hypothetical protein
MICRHAAAVQLVFLKTLELVAMVVRTPNVVLCSVLACHEVFAMAKLANALDVWQLIAVDLKPEDMLGLLRLMGSQYWDGYSAA